MATGIQTGMQRGSRSGISRGSALGKGAPGGGGGPLGKAQEIFKNLSKGAKIAISVGLVLLVCGGIGLGLHSKQNAYVELYQTKMTPTDVQEVSTALNKLNIPHQLNITSDGILVHPKKKLGARAQLASINLPRHHVLTPDQVSNGMGKTAAEQKAVRQRLVEGEITLALREMEGINDARVKLAVPDKTYFLDDSKHTTARVFLKMKPSSPPTREKIAGIINLVAFSVPELRPEDVRVIDSSGKDLTAMVPQGEDGMMAGGTQFEIQAAEEIRLQKKAQKVLDRVMPGRAEVSVNLVMDNSKVETERYVTGGAGDDGVVVTGRQVTREVLNKDPKSTSGGQQMSTGGDKKNASDYVNEKESVNYDTNKNIVKKVDTSIRIGRITASVMADNVSEEEAVKIAGFVRDAIGIDESRGDTIGVQSIAFDRTMGGGQSPMGMPNWEEPIAPAAGGGLTGSHLTAAVTVGAAMFLGLLGMFLFKQHKVQGDQGAIMSATPSGMTATTITDHFTTKNGETTAPTTSAGATQVNTTDQLEQLVKEKPNKVAEMLKSTWLS